MRRTNKNDEEEQYAVPCPITGSTQHGYIMPHPTNSQGEHPRVTRESTAAPLHKRLSNILRRRPNIREDPEELGSITPTTERKQKRVKRRSTAPQISLAKLKRRYLETKVSYQNENALQGHDNNVVPCPFTGSTEHVYIMSHPTNSQGEKPKVTRESTAPLHKRLSNILKRRSHIREDQEELGSITPKTERKQKKVKRRSTAPQISLAKLKRRDLAPKVSFEDESDWQGHNNNVELSSTDLTINFMNPYKDYHEIIYLKALLPIEYEHMIHNWDI